MAWTVSRDDNADCKLNLEVAIYVASIASDGRSFMPSLFSCLGLCFSMLDIEDSWPCFKAPRLLLLASAGFLSFPIWPIFYLLVGVGTKVRTFVFSAEAFLLFFYPLPGVASLFFAASAAAAASIFYYCFFLFLSALAYFFKILSCFINNNCFKIIRSFGSSTALIAS